MAHAKHDAVRSRFSHCCGYCGVSETDAAGDLTVDHYQPISSGGDDNDENLVYCCVRCNLYKGDFWPTPVDVHHGRRVLHPERDALESHYRLNIQTGNLEPITDTERFHIELLRLNRPALTGHRLQKRLTSLLVESHQLLEEENSRLRRTIAAQEEYLRRLWIMLGS